MKRFFEIFFTIMLAVALLAGTGRAATEKEGHDAKQVLAEVNGRKIYSGEFEKLLQGRSDPQMLLDQIVSYIVLGDEGQKKGIETTGEINEQLKAMKEQQLAQYLYSKEIESKAEIADEELEKMIPESERYKVNFQQIILKTKDEAEATIKAIKGGGDFNKLAKSKSIANNASKGGQIGYVIPNTGYFEGEIGEEDENKIFKLKEGEISDPIKTRQGYAIFKSVGKKELSAQEMDSRKNYLKYKLQKTRVEKAKDALLDRLRSKAKIELEDKNIKKLEKAEKIDTKSLDFTLAKVDDQEIKLKDILPPQRGEYGGNQLNSPYLKQHGFLENMINEKINSILFITEAKRLKYDQNEDFIHLYELFKDGLMGQAYAMEQVKDLKVSDDELKAYFEENKEKFKDMPERIRVRHILVTDEAKAKDFLNKVKSGADFAKLAEENSICPSASNGGDLGYFSRGRMAPLFEEAAFKLKKGEVSDVVKTNFGYHIIKMEDYKPAGASSFNDLKYELEQTVLFQKRDKKIRELIEQLKSKSTIKINQELLKQYQVERPASPMQKPPMPGTN